MHWSDLASFLKTTAEQLHIPAGFCTVTQAHRTLFSCACGADKDALVQARHLTVNPDYPRTTPRGGTGYGVLVIWDGGSYAFHLYRDNSGTLYSAKNSTVNGAVQKPASWAKHAGTSVGVQT